MSATIKSGPCEGCGQPMSRELPPDGPLSGVLARAGLWCDACVTAGEEADGERQRREVDRRRDAKVAERLRRSGLPDRHRRAIDSLDHPAEVLGPARDWAGHGGGLLLTGEVGRGKTMIAGSACWERLRVEQVLWTSAPLLMARLGSGFGSAMHDRAVEVLTGREALVLDDVDKTRPTQYGAEQIFNAVDLRVEHESSLLVTTNLSLSGLAERWPEPFGEAIASRLVGYCRVVKVEGSDRRLAGAQPTTQGAAR